MGDLLADRIHHLVAPGRNADGDSRTTQKQQPEWNGRLSGHLPCGRDLMDCRHRTDRIGHIVGTVGEGDITGGDDLQPDEDAFDARIALFLELEAAQDEVHQETCDHADCQRDENRIERNPGTLCEGIECRPLLGGEPMLLADVLVESFERLELQG